MVRAGTEEARLLSLFQTQLLGRGEIASLSFFPSLFLTCAVFCTSPRLWMFPKNLFDLAFWMRLETACCREEGERETDEKKKNGGSSLFDEADHHHHRRLSMPSLPRVVFASSAARPRGTGPLRPFPEQEGRTMAAEREREREREREKQRRERLNFFKV